MGLVEARAVHLLFVYLINTVLANLVVLWGFLNQVSNGVNCSFTSDSREKCEVTVLAVWVWALQEGFML